ncbi:MAG: TonB C-terminal domain-containing protein [Cyanobacteria bacterium SZAS LIN-5]|nr:TonB C-terminal domain-containing protein [Cyanobacteria bacterium SZAS LIN-5]
MCHSSAKLLVLIGLISSVSVQAEPTHCVVNREADALERSSAAITNIFVNVSSAIKKSELASGGFRKHSVSCSMTLEPDGSITDLEITKSSGSKSIDEDSMSVIKNAKILPYSSHLGNQNIIVEFRDHVFAGAAGTVDFVVKSQR